MIRFIKWDDKTLQEQEDMRNNPFKPRKESDSIKRHAKRIDINNNPFEPRKESRY